MENQEDHNINNPTSNKKIFILIVLISIISIAIGFTFGFYFGLNKSFTPQSTPTNNQPVIDQNTSHSPTPQHTIDTSNTITPTPLLPQTITKIPNWQTYTNSVHKYTVQYPKDWSIDISNADNQEYHLDSTCCNNASLIISKDQTQWEFSINQLYTGFDAPDECQQEPQQCEYLLKNINVLGYPLYRVIIRQNSSQKIIEGYLSTPQENNTHRRGFGQIGIDTDYVSPDSIKYFINYTGPEIDKYLTTLDRITESLQAIK